MERKVFYTTSIDEGKAIKDLSYKGFEKYIADNFDVVDTKIDYTNNCDFWVKDVGPAAKIGKKLYTDVVGAGAKISNSKGDITSFSFYKSKKIDMSISVRKSKGILEKGDFLISVAEVITHY